MAIELNVTNSIAGQVNIDDIARHHGYTGFELVKDENGELIPEMEQSVNDDGSLGEMQVKVENGQIVYEKIGITTTEFVQKYVVPKYVLPMIRVAVEGNEKEQGILNYNANQYYDMFKATTEFEVVVND